LRVMRKKGFMTSNMMARFEAMQATLQSKSCADWKSISSFLDTIQTVPPNPIDSDSFAARLKKGIAFYTFDYGIDGVSIEVAKYARCLEEMLREPSGSKVPIHMIAGDFHDQADQILDSSWPRFQIEGMNGWSKWCEGEWFSKLYHEDLPAGSDLSNDVAREIWHQTVAMACTLGRYLAVNDISLVIPVNVASNPGNLVAQLAIVIVSEMMGLYVLNSNHDFYWEGGKPAQDRVPEEEEGPRDYFFRNQQNAPFFSLFERLYPWSGAQWIQVNINPRQSRKLVDRFSFDPKRVFEMGTSVDDIFFETFTLADQRDARRRMAYILSDGEPTVPTVGISGHLATLTDWVSDQKPLLLGARTGISVNPTHKKTIYCLQPTRVVERKRIEKDFHLLRALMGNSAFFDSFSADTERQIVVHISGPVPIEHQADLETVLCAYKELLDSVPKEIAERIFVAFSVGTEDHPSLSKNGLEPLAIESIYRLATVILFPSETEGRGLPIIESRAVGIPIICSRYYPDDVFSNVVGEHLPPEKQLHYLTFPEDEFSEEFLVRVAMILLEPESIEAHRKHDQEAVRSRYSRRAMQKNLERCLEALRLST